MGCCRCDSPFIEKRMKKIKRIKWKQLVAGALSVFMLLGEATATDYQVLAAQNTYVEMDSASHTWMIKGFKELPEQSATISVAKKVPLQTLLLQMPGFLEVYLEGNSETTMIPVTWECAGDYENSNYYYYQFNPKWDTTQYRVSAQAAGEIPYVGVFLGGNSSIKFASGEENRDKIYKFMKEEMGFNTAAACGVVANIQCESSFRPSASVIDTNGLPSYGICQWNGPRFEALKSFCAARGYDYTSLEGQLYYLKYELSGSEARACGLVKNVENTAQGAYTAGYNWARYFERCASVWHESRGNLARDTYWPMYGETTTKKKKYSIKYHLNGGENHDDNPNTYYNTSGTITLKDPTLQGYSFAGWYTDSSMTKKITTIASGSEGNLELYAKWNANKYTIKFYGNKATEGSMSDMKDCEYDCIYTLSKNQYKRTGYKFAGWNTKKNGKGTPYDNKEDVSNLSAENGAVIKLYAQWTKQMYQITYKTNGGELPENYRTEYDVNTKTFDLPKPERTGYTFLGWYKESSYKTKLTKVEKGSSGNLKLYAKWKEHKYKLKYHGNGATSGSMPGIKTYKYGKKYTLAANKFKRKGYKFAGWNTKADGSGKIYNNKEKVKKLTAKDGKTVTLYAQWERPVYTITYEYNGGVPQKMNRDEYYENTKTFKLNEPVREGYTFLGWYKEKSFKNKITKIKKGSKKNYTLYAKWKPNQYRIVFDGNGAQSGSMTPMEACNYDETYLLTQNGFVRDGYNFVGWNTMPDGSGAFYGNQAQVKNLSAANGAAITLYAIWE